MQVVHRTFTVGIYERRGRMTARVYQSPRYRPRLACEHQVTGTSHVEARRIAMAEHEGCIAQRQALDAEQREILIRIEGIHAKIRQAMVADQMNPDSETFWLICQCLAHLVEDPTGVQLVTASPTLGNYDNVARWMEAVEGAFGDALEDLRASEAIYLPVCRAHDVLRSEDASSRAGGGRRGGVRGRGVGAMTPPKIQALGIVQDGSPTRWHATGYVAGVGWLEAWGKTLIEAMEALQALAAERVAERGTGDGPRDEGPP